MRKIKFLGESGGLKVTHGGGAGGGGGTILTRPVS